MKEKENKKAIFLRQKGFSLNEISKILKISKSTASVWLKDVKIGVSGKDIINNRIKNGLINSNITKKKQEKKFYNKIIKNNKKMLVRASALKGVGKLYCALLHWCEGNKDNHSVRFTNSDPKMIKTYLTLLRKSFDINEKRLRICMHLHDYHSEEKQKLFWSHITGISKKQFIKTYWKHHSGIRTKNDYEGCISLRYGDSKIAKELNNLWQLFANQYGGA